ncbi:MAG: hypothetical protein ACFFD4_39700 [Candidatus Odinarchaeota archaeon]
MKWTRKKKVNAFENDRSFTSISTALSYLDEINRKKNIDRWPDVCFLLSSRHQEVSRKAEEVLKEILKPLEKINPVDANKVDYQLHRHIEVSADEMFDAHRRSGLLSLHLS